VRRFLPEPIGFVLDGAIDPFIEAFLKWKGRKY